MITETITPSTTMAATKDKKKSEVDQLLIPKPREIRSSKKEGSKEKQVLESPSHYLPPTKKQARKKRRHLKAKK